MSLLVAGANARASQGGLAKISDAGEETVSEKGVEAEEDTSAGKRLSIEEQLSPGRKRLLLLDEDDQAITRRG